MLDANSIGFHANPDSTDAESVLPEVKFWAPCASHRFKPPDRHCGHTAGHMTCCGRHLEKAMPSVVLPLSYE